MRHGRGAPSSEDPDDLDGGAFSPFDERPLDAIDTPQSRVQGRARHSVGQYRYRVHIDEGESSGEEADRILFSGRVPFLQIRRMVESGEFQGYFLAGKLSPLQGESCRQGFI